MRARLEREQGPRNPLKAGAGGYYDIDFALMYLRLKGAGIFYKVLNTPERIDVIEKMGHLDREDADFLREAATFYRALDHGQRVSMGHAEGSLPTSQAQFEVLTELVKRWTPEHLHQRAAGRDAARDPPTHARIFQPPVRQVMSSVIALQELLLMLVGRAICVAASRSPAESRWQPEWLPHYRVTAPELRLGHEGLPLRRLGRDRGRHSGAVPHPAAAKINTTTVALTLLLAILGYSAWWGLAEATVASVVAVLGFNYFFLPPVGTLTIQDPQNWVALRRVSGDRRDRQPAFGPRAPADRRGRGAPAGNRAAVRPGAGHDARRQRAQDHPRIRQQGGAGIRLRRRRRSTTGPPARFSARVRRARPVSDHDLLAAAEIDDVSVDPDARAGHGAGAAGRPAAGEHGADRVAAFGADRARHRRTWWPSPSKRRARWRMPATPRPRGRARC